MDNAIRVSIAELLEVRGDGLYAPELLSIIVASCETLQKLGKYGVFNNDFVFLTPDGEIEIRLVSPAEVSEESIPPELREQLDYDDVSTIREPQMVWCLGEMIKQTCARACTDAELFSLLNFMTIDSINGRPTILKVCQMSKNKCSAGEIEIIGVLKALYEEVMGDIDDLMDEDIESTTGYSGSGINGQGNEQQTNLIQANRISTNIQETPPSTSTSEAEEDEIDSSMNVEQYGNHFRSGVLPVVEEETTTKQATRIERRVSNDSTTTGQSSLSEGTLAESRKSSISSIRTIPEVLEENNEKETTPKEEKSFVFESPKQQMIEENVQKENNEIIPISPTKNEIISEDVFPLMTTKKSTPQQLHKQPSRISEDDEEDVPPTQMPLPPSPKLIPKNSPMTAISARKKSKTGSVSSTEFNVPTTILPKMTTRKSDEDIDQPGRLSRHNSLGPDRIRRSSRRNKGPSPYYHQQNQIKRNFALPEFVEKENLAVVRLQAQSIRKKRLTLHRIESTYVLVKIINGQTVEVNCKSDALVGNIFDTVVDHFKLTEHNFFGLTVLRDGEHFFLENEQRLEKYAPPGWKNLSKRIHSEQQYFLYLKFRYYPKKIDFIKTTSMIHCLYLQLRQDVLSDHLIPIKDKLFQLGALALQAEYGNPPSPPKLGERIPYFQLKNYLPNCILYNEESIKLEKILSEIHSHYHGLTTIDAEKSFIDLCQKENQYGSHYYRVHKFKPLTKSPSDRYADNYWISILPDGIGICTKNNNSTTITTTSTPTNLILNTFFSWHIIRTLQFDRKRFLISIIENNIPKDYVFYTDHYTKSSYLVKFAASQHKFMMKMRFWQSTLTREKPLKKDVEIERNNDENNYEIDTLFPKLNTKSSTTTTPQQQRIQTESFSTIQSTTSTTNDNEMIEIEIILEKDPVNGLGLTLVDGTVNDVQGVYVKNVSENGNAKKKGIVTGDCIKSINNISLIDKTRHDAVNLVKESDNNVKLIITRFPYITQLISHDRQKSKEDILPNINGKTKQLPNKLEMLTGKRNSQTSLSKTPPPNKKSTNLQVQQPRQRAISDFGAVGDALPVLNSEDLLIGLHKQKRIKSESESDDENEKHGEYRLPVTTIYNFHASDDEDDKEHSKKLPNERNFNHIDDTTSWVSKTTVESSIQKSIQSNRQNLDWTHELSDIEDSRKDSMERIKVVIHRLGTKSLGFQVATSNGFVYVKAVSAEPALSADLKVDDRIIMINGRPTSGMSHQDVVDSLRTDRSPIIELTVDRMRLPTELEQTITVTLEKSQESSLGLSLAKRMGHEGIFVRNISSGSIAEKDGRLKVGDRIWEIDGQNVSEESTNAIVEKLKSNKGTLVEIVVKRLIE